MKKIYFVRHGEGTGNVDSSCKEALSSLTSRGCDQAHHVAARYDNIKIDKVITSTMLRAQQTALIISEKINSPIEHSPLFVERRKPSEQDGVPKDNEVAFHAATTSKKNFAVPGYRFSDEENFDDLKERARAAIHYLEEIQGENILVVTHDFFMRVLVAYAIFGEHLTAEQCQHFTRKFHMEHAGITVMGYDSDNADSSWHMYTWNDHAHVIPQKTDGRN